MKNGALLIVSVTLLAGCSISRTTTGLSHRLQVDYHQHLVSPAFAPLAKLPARDSKALVAELDAAGVAKAIVLSVGYSFADERKNLPNPDHLTRQENDWTSAQVVASGGRLRGFCSANPLRDAALDELDRCLSLPGMHGIKLHFGNSGLTLRNPDHVGRMQRVFDLAGRRRAALLVHMRYRGGADYGPEDSHTFIERLLPHALGTDIIVAHLAGSGPGYSKPNDVIMTEFAEAAERRDPRLARVYFDIATNVTAGTTPADGARIAARIRQVGPNHILYGSDLSPPGGSIRSGWDIFLSKVPLKPAEFKAIASNRLNFTW